MASSALRLPDSDGEITAAAFSWIDLDSRSRMILTRTLQILWMNPLAASALSGGGPLTECDGRLIAAEAAQHQMLVQIATEVEDEPRSCFVKCADEASEALVVTVQRVRGGPAPLVGLSFRSGGPLCAGDALRSAFQLTKAEARVLMLMVDGHMADEVSARLSVGIETIRTHIRQIYAKMGVKSREAMFRRVLPFCW